MSNGIVSSITRGGQTEPFDLQMARGQILGHNTLQIFGYSTAIGNNQQAIWEGSSTSAGGDYTFPSAAVPMTIVSSSASDTMAVFVAGLDANFNMISESITLTGTTPVTTVNSYYRINGLYVVSGSNVGTITCGYSVATTGASGNLTSATITFSGTYVFPVGSYIKVAGVTPTGYNTTSSAVTASSAGSVTYANITTGSQTVAGTVFQLYAQINPGNGLTQMSIYTVPKGFTFFKTQEVYNGTFSSSNYATVRQQAVHNTSGSVNVGGYAIPYNGNTAVTEESILQNQISTIFAQPFGFGQGTDIKWQAITSGGGVNGAVSVAIYGYLIQTNTLTTQPGN